MMSLRTWWRDKGALFWGILFPLLLMGLIGFVFGGTESLTFTVSVSLPEGDPLAAGALEALRQVEVFDVVVEEEAVGLERLREGSRSLVVVLPGLEDGQPGGAVKVYYDDVNAQVNQAGIAIVRQVVDELNRRITGRPDVIRLETAGISAEKLTIFDFMLPGILAMTLMQTGLMGVTWVIANYRERLVLKRVLATPFHPAAFIAGLVARFTVVNLMQGAIIFLVATYLYGARTQGSLLELAALAVVGSVTFLAIGFAVSSLSKTAESANNLGSLINFPMLFLSGTFWPRELLPEGIRPVVAALPLSPLVDAMRGVGASGDSITAYGGDIAYLLAWAAVAFAVAAWRFRWE